MRRMPLTLEAFVLTLFTLSSLMPPSVLECIVHAWVRAYANLHIGWAKEQDLPHLNQIRRQILQIHHLYGCYVNVASYNVQLYSPSHFIHSLFGSVHVSMSNKDALFLQRVTFGAMSFPWRWYSSSWVGLHHMTLDIILYGSLERPFF